MAELEALTQIRETDDDRKAGRKVEPRDALWRVALPPNKPVRIGRVADDVDDPMVSLYHATLTWDGTELTVEQRPVSQQYPKEPTNPVWFNGAKVKACRVRLRERFVIGQTTFTVRPAGDSSPASPIDGTVVQHAQDYTRPELLGLPFSAPSATALKALEQVPNVLRRP